MMFEKVYLILISIFCCRSSGFQKKPRTNVLLGILIRFRKSPLTSSSSLSSSQPTHIPLDVSDKHDKSSNLVCFGLTSLTLFILIFAFPLDKST